MAMVKVPDGKGGYVEMEATPLDGQTANVDKQAQALAAASEEARWKRIGLAAENFNKYHKAYGSDFNLSPEELAQAIYLEVLNWKEFWPASMGGKEQFDALCKEVWDWFQANKDK